MFCTSELLPLIDKFYFKPFLGEKKKKQKWNVKACSSEEFTCLD